MMPSAEVNVKNGTMFRLDQVNAKAFDRCVWCEPCKTCTLEPGISHVIVIDGYKKTQITHIELKLESGAADFPLPSFKLYKIWDGARTELVPATAAGVWIVICDCHYEIADN